MDTDLTTLCFAAARGCQFASCLLIAGICVFDRVIVCADLRREANRIAGVSFCILLVGLVMAALSGVVWFGVVVIGMSGLPIGEALQPHMIWKVWTHTQFGRLWQIRSIFWIATALITLGIYRARAKPRIRSAAVWLTTVFGAALLGSLAWSGHGRNGEPARWHLLADVVHLLVAAAWPTGLLPFGLSLYALRGNVVALAKLTRRFSAMSLLGVCILTISGFVNSVYLLGSVSNLFSTSYGHVLLAKIAVFVVMIGLGAVNLYYFKPRISAGDAAIAGKLRRTVGVEFICGAAVVAIVAVLGTLPPPQ